MSSALRVLFLMGLAVAGATACDGGGTGGSAVMPQCTEPTAVACTDEIILNMNLQPDPAPGLINSMNGNPGWISTIDATAGGAFAATPDSYTYGKFGSGGLTK